MLFIWLMFVCFFYGNCDHVDLHLLTHSVPTRCSYVLFWICPAPETIDLMGDKISARRFVAERGFPVAPSVIEDDDPDNFAAHARTVGAPLLIKPPAGGGGKGMRLVRDFDTLEAEIATARAEGAPFFRAGRSLSEHFCGHPRHTTVQSMG